METQSDIWLSRLPLGRDKPWIGYGFAVLVGFLAYLLRVAFDSVLPPGFPYVTFFPAVVAVAFLFGPKPGVLTAAIGFLASWYFFIPPVGFGVNGGTIAALGLYLFVVVVDVLLIHWLQQANARNAQARELNLRLAETRETLFHELQHRVGNNLQMVASLLALQKRKLTEPAAVAAIGEAAERVNLIGRIQRQLYDPGGKQHSLAELLERVAREATAANGRPDAEIILAVDTSMYVGADLAIPTSLIVAEAVANAIEHGFGAGEGQIRVEADYFDRRIRIAVIDDGKGLPENFSVEQSSSLGLKLSNALARQIGATFDLRSALGQTRAELLLPSA